jgi:three-Cys-motif partner protein
MVLIAESTKVLPDDFFDERQAQSAFKHEILERYLPKFAAKLGTSYRKVAILDGYSGPGRYADGTAGSPELVAKTALKLRAPGRAIQCIYVEQKKAYFLKLKEVLAGIPHDADPRHGKIEDELPKIVDSIGDTPLLAFLDPFGACLPLDVLTRNLLKRPRPEHRTHKTEVLINFSVRTLGRMAAQLEAEASTMKAVNAKNTTLEHVDAIVGGEWWRDLWLETPEPYRERVLSEEYLKVLAETGEGWDVWPVPVPRYYGGPPVYYLLLLTQSYHGLWEFNNAVSMASRNFIQASMNATKEGGQTALFGDDELHRLRDQEFTGNVELNVRCILSTVGTFRVADHLREVFNGVEGLARETHLKKALVSLKAADAILEVPTNPLLEKTVRPKGLPQPPREARPSRWLRPVLRPKSVLRGAVPRPLGFDPPTA